MIPFQKIFTLVVRTFSKPVLNYLKLRQQQNRMKSVRWIFVGIGRRQQIFEHWLNHKILKTTQKKQLNQLKEQILLERGVEALYELLLYCILIGLPMYELYTSAISTQKKQKKLSENINSMQLQLKQLNQNLGKIISDIKHRSQYSEKLQKERVEKIQSIKKERTQSRKKEYKKYLAAKQSQEKERLNKLMIEETLQKIEEKSQNLQENFVTNSQEPNLQQSTESQSFVPPVQRQETP